MKRSTVHARRALPAVALGLVGVLALSACASSSDSSSTSTDAATSTASGLPQNLIDAAVDAATEAADGQELSGKISVLGVATGAEGDAFAAAMKPFTDATGVTIDYTGSQDQATVVSAGVEAGNAPDIVDGQGLGLLKQYATTGKVMSLSEVIGDDMLTENYNQGLIDSTTFDGEVYGLWNEADTFQIWYNPNTYEGPTDGSWSDLTAWADEEAASGSGVAPWCMALEAGPGSGFPAQSWIENVFVKKYGSEKLAEWANGTLPWTSDEVRWAWEQFGAVATSSTLVNGGPQAVVSTSAFAYSDGMYTDPQQCELTLWGNYAAGIVQGSHPEATIPDNLDFFPVPASDEAYSGDLDIAGHVTFALTDSPETQAFMKYWATAEAQSLIAASGSWTVANKNVSMDVYPNAAMKSSAELLQSSTTLTPGPASSVQSAVNSAYLTGIMSYVQDPGSLTTILEGIQSAAE
jgi:alpha-glucoside transport system substrate-binding protein